MEREREYVSDSFVAGTSALSSGIPCHMQIRDHSNSKYVLYSTLYVQCTMYGPTALLVVLFSCFSSLYKH